MRRVRVAIGLIACCTLAVELLLTRVFDVILYPNLGYMIITGAMFSFGLAGIYSTLWPIAEEAAVRRSLVRYATALAAALAVIRPALNAIPFRFESIAAEPGMQALWFLLMYLVVTLPFFLAGMIFARTFSTWASQIQTLYFWDLCGAAIGCVIIVPLIPSLGPGGLILVAAALCSVAAAIFAATRRAAFLATVALIAALGWPLATMPGYLDFVEHKGDRGLAMARREGRTETVRWDPISKIEVISLGWVKNIIYDGGSQSSFLYPFEGDLEWLRAHLDRSARLNDEEAFLGHFWTRGVVLSHYLRRDRDQRVMIIGSAAGQELKAALAYGAGHVDAVEMVGTVVELGKTKYADFNGGIFNLPNVHAVRGEGRGFLRSQGNVYDIIQIFSNHSSSSVAAGAGAIDPTYLLTADAFVDYFTHLTDDGILQVNHHTYPRIVATAALAWRWMGRDDFRRHVLVLSKSYADDDSLPSVLIKMTPWSDEDMREVNMFMSLRRRFEEQFFNVDEDPQSPGRSFLSDEFYSGQLSAETIAAVPYRVVPTTDDRPYFKFLRRSWAPMEPDSERFVSSAIASYMNQQRDAGGGVPMDVIHLYVTGGVSLLFAFVFILLPLASSKVARQRWPGWGASMGYFSCLGAGFILIELVLIHMLMHFVGYPLYTYSLVLFTVLLGAGQGSFASERLGISPTSPRWWWPFAGVLACGLGFLATHQLITASLLGLPVPVRMAITFLYIFPVAFFMGMPFPLGILAVERLSRSAVAWGWGMNGLFTVIGGLASILISVFLGFRVGMLAGLAIYVLAGLLFHRMRSQAPQTSPAPSGD